MHETTTNDPRKGFQSSTPTPSFSASPLSATTSHSARVTATPSARVSNDDSSSKGPTISSTGLSARLTTKTRFRWRYRDRVCLEQKTIQHVNGEKQPVSSQMLYMTDSSDDGSIPPSSDRKSAPSGVSSERISNTSNRRSPSQQQEDNFYNSGANSGNASDTQGNSARKRSPRNNNHDGSPRGMERGGEEPEGSHRTWSLDREIREDVSQTSGSRVDDIEWDYSDFKLTVGGDFNTDGATTEVDGYVKGQLLPNFEHFDDVSVESNPRRRTERRRRRPRDETKRTPQIVTKFGYHITGGLKKNRTNGNPRAPEAVANEGGGVNIGDRYASTRSDSGYLDIGSGSVSANDNSSQASRRDTSVDVEVFQLASDPVEEATEEREEEDVEGEAMKRGQLPDNLTSWTKSQGGAGHFYWGFANDELTPTTASDESHRVPTNVDQPLRTEDDASTSERQVTESSRDSNHITGQDFEDSLEICSSRMDTKLDPKLLKNQSRSLDHFSDSSSLYDSLEGTPLSARSLQNGSMEFINEHYDISCALCKRRSHCRRHGHNSNTSSHAQHANSIPHLLGTLRRESAFVKEGNRANWDARSVTSSHTQTRRVVAASNHTQTEHREAPIKNSEARNQKGDKNNVRDYVHDSSENNMSAEIKAAGLKLTHHIDINNSSGGVHRSQSFNPNVLTRPRSASRQSSVNQTLSQRTGQTYQKSGTKTESFYAQRFQEHIERKRNSSQERPRVALFRSASFSENLHAAEMASKSTKSLLEKSPSLELVGHLGTGRKLNHHVSRATAMGGNTKRSVEEAGKAENVSTRVAMPLSARSYRARSPSPFLARTPANRLAESSTQQQLPNLSTSDDSECVFEAKCKVTLTQSLRDPLRRKKMQDAETEMVSSESVTSSADAEGLVNTTTSSNGLCLSSSTTSTNSNTTETVSHSDANSSYISVSNVETQPFVSIKLPHLQSVPTSHGEIAKAFSTSTTSTVPTPLTISTTPVSSPQGIACSYTSTQMSPVASSPPGSGVSSGVVIMDFSEMVPTVTVNHGKRKQAQVKNANDKAQCKENPSKATNDSEKYSDRCRESECNGLYVIKDNTSKPEPNRDRATRYSNSSEEGLKPEDFPVQSCERQLTPPDSPDENTDHAMFQMLLPVRTFRTHFSVDKIMMSSLFELWTSQLLGTHRTILIAKLMDYYTKALQRKTRCVSVFYRDNFLVVSERTDSMDQSLDGPSFDLSWSPEFMSTPREIQGRDVGGRAGETEEEMADSSIERSHNVSEALARLTSQHQNLRSKNSSQHTDVYAQYQRSTGALRNGGSGGRLFRDLDFSTSSAENTSVWDSQLDSGYELVHDAAPSVSWWRNGGEPQRHEKGNSPSSDCSSDSTDTFCCDDQEDDNVTLNSTISAAPTAALSHSYRMEGPNTDTIRQADTIIVEGLSGRKRYASTIIISKWEHGDSSEDDAISECESVASSCVSSSHRFVSALNIHAPPLPNLQQPTCQSFLCHASNLRPDLEIGLHRFVCLDLPIKIYPETDAVGDTLYIEHLEEDYSTFFSDGSTAFKQEQSTTGSGTYSTYKTASGVDLNASFESTLSDDSAEMTDVTNDSTTGGDDVGETGGGNSDKDQSSSSVWDDSSTGLTQKQRHMVHLSSSLEKESETVQTMHTLNTQHEVNLGNMAKMKSPTLDSLTRSPLVDEIENVQEYHSCLSDLVQPTANSPTLNDCHATDQKEIKESNKEVSVQYVADKNELGNDLMIETGQSKIDSSESIIDNESDSLRPSIQAKPPLPKASKPETDQSSDSGEWAYQVTMQYRGPEGATVPSNSGPDSATPGSLYHFDSRLRSFYQQIAATGQRLPSWMSQGGPYEEMETNFGTTGESNESSVDTSTESKRAANSSTSDDKQQIDLATCPISQVLEHVLGGAQKQSDEVADQSAIKFKEYASITESKQQFVICMPETLNDTNKHTLQRNHSLGDLENETRVLRIMDFASDGVPISTLLRPASHLRSLPDIRLLCEYYSSQSTLHISDEERELLNRLEYDAERTECTTYTGRERQRANERTGTNFETTSEQSETILSSERRAYSEGIGSEQSDGMRSRDRYGYSDEMWSERSETAQSKRCSQGKDARASVLDWTDTGTMDGLSDLGGGSLSALPRSASDPCGLLNKGEDARMQEAALEDDVFHVTSQRDDHVVRRGSLFDDIVVSEVIEERGVKSTECTTSCTTPCTSCTNGASTAACYNSDASLELDEEKTISVNVSFEIGYRRQRAVPDCEGEEGLKQLIRDCRQLRDGLLADAARLTQHMGAELENNVSDESLYVEWVKGSDEDVEGTAIAPRAVAISGSARGGGNRNAIAPTEQADEFLCVGLARRNSQKILDVLDKDLSLLKRGASEQWEHIPVLDCGDDDVSTTQPFNSYARYTEDVSLNTLQCVNGNSTPFETFALPLSPDTDLPYTSVTNEDALSVDSNECVQNYSLLSTSSLSGGLPALREHLFPLTEPEPMYTNVRRSRPGLESGSDASERSRTNPDNVYPVAVLQSGSVSDDEHLQYVGDCIRAHFACQHGIDPRALANDVCERDEWCSDSEEDVRLHRSVSARELSRGAQFGSTIAAVQSIVSGDTAISDHLSDEEDKDFDEAREEELDRLLSQPARLLAPQKRNADTDGATQNRAKQRRLLYIPPQGDFVVGCEGGSEEEEEDEGPCLTVSEGTTTAGKQDTTLSSSMGSTSYEDLSEGLVRSSVALTLNFAWQSSNKDEKSSAENASKNQAELITVANNKDPRNRQEDTACLQSATDSDESCLHSQNVLKHCNNIQQILQGMAPSDT